MLLLDRSNGCEHYKQLYFRCEKNGIPFELKTGCHARFEIMCPVCSKKWAAMTKKRLSLGIAAMKAPKLITLTLTKRRSVDENLNRIWDLRRALFRRLRKKRYRIGAWVGVVELPNHIHLVADTSYIPQRKISTIWKALSGDSYIVDIRPLRGAERGAGYVSKYLSKALGANMPPDLLKGFHVVQTHGILALPKNGLKCPCCGGPVFVISPAEAFILDNEHRDTG